MFISSFGGFVPFSLLQALLGARSLSLYLFAFVFSYAFLSRIGVICFILPHSLGAVVYWLQRATIIRTSVPQNRILHKPALYCLYFTREGVNTLHSGTVLSVAYCLLFAVEKHLVLDLLAT